MLSLSKQDLDLNTNIKNIWVMFEFMVNDPVIGYGISDKIF